MDTHNQKRPLVLWIHGFGGKANNDTVKEMVKRYVQYEFYSIEVNHHALESMIKINDFINEHDVAVVAGTSLGSFYAMCADFAGNKFVVNPVVNPLRDLRQFIGMNTYKPGRADGLTDFEFTEDMLNEFGRLSIGNTDNVLCHHALHDQVIGSAIIDDYRQIFSKRKEIDEKILPNHFLTFKYIKTEFGKALESMIKI